jgi:hypothetical protein
MNKSIQITENKFAGTIGFKAKANIYVEGKLLFVSFSGSAGGEAASAIKATIPSQLTFKASVKNDEDHLKIGGGIDFTGLALYYVMKGSIELKKDAESKGNGDAVLGSRSAGAKTSLSKESKEAKSIVLFKAWDDKHGEKDAYRNLEHFFD